MPRRAWGYNKKKYYYYNRDLKDSNNKLVEQIMSLKLYIENLEKKNKKVNYVLDIVLYIRYNTLCT